MSVEMGFVAVGALPGGASVSLVKTLAVAAMLLPWLYAATWIHKDAPRVRVPQLLWAGGTLAAGLLGVALWLLVPWYSLGMGIYLVLAGGVVGVYIAQRNRKVVPSARVLTSEHIHSVLTRQKSQTVEVVQRIKLYDSLGRPVFPPDEDEPAQRQAYNVAQNFLSNVVMFRASQAEVVAAGPKAVIRYVVDGVVQQRPSAARADAEKVIDFIKQIASMDVEDRRRPQEGKIALEAGDVPLDVVVLTAGTTHGQRMLLKIVQEVARTQLDELGLPDDLLARLKKLNAAPGGLIIVSGAAHSGVTSTMYSLLRCQDAFMKQLATMEQSSTVDLENVTQVSYTDQPELGGLLASLLRRDPDVVMVDRCETARTAQIIIGAAPEKNFLLGMTADNSFTALAKWVKLTGDARPEAVRILRAVTCQILLRRLCPECREAYRPAREMLAKLNLPADRIDRLYRPRTRPRTDDKGNPIVCPACRGTGYCGRTGVFELLELNTEVRQLILEDASLSRIKAACRKNKMLYLQEQALRKVIEGVTAVDEVIRALSK